MDEYKLRQKLEAARSFGSVSAVIFGALIITCLSMYGCPRYNVWQKGLAGQAELAQAEYNRQITIREAEAKRESAKSLADAEIERARGVAEANKIIGESLKNNEGYLRYLWITELSENNNNVIYIPTETGMPILEAGKR